MIILKPELNAYFPESPEGFTEIMALEGRVYRELEGRRTIRIVLDDHPYFVKQHNGVGWKEILKNLSQLRYPIISAKNEWQALERLAELEVPVPEALGYGRRGCNPARTQSFIITRELPKHISLEYFCKTWNICPPAFTLKRKLIQEVAKIARLLHTHGMNHRDFYICHFLLDLDSFSNGSIKLYLIDLHRAAIRKHTPTRWVIKDLAGLYFSSKEIGLTKRDILRFIKEYRNKSLSDILKKESTFWHKVKKRGDKLYGKCKT